MNFLELCQRTASECGVSITGPSDTTNQTGRLGQLVKWVNTAWMHLQTKHDNWLFMRFGFQVDTTSGDGEYAYGDCTDTTTSVAIAAFRDWCRDTPLKVYLVSAGQATETDLVFKDYREFYQLYLIGTPTNSYPRHWSRAPNGNLLLGPKPDGIYRVSGEYQRSGTELSGDSDVPELPSEYHMAIVYRAMMQYGRYVGAQEIYNDGAAEYRRMLREMRRTQLPRVVEPGPLA